MTPTHTFASPALKRSTFLTAATASSPIVPQTSHQFNGVHVHAYCRNSVSLFKWLVFHHCDLIFLCCLEMCDHPIVGCLRPGERYNTIIGDHQYQILSPPLSLLSTGEPRQAYLAWCHSLELEYLRRIIRNDGAEHWDEFFDYAHQPEFWAHGCYLVIQYHINRRAHFVFMMKFYNWNLITRWWNHQ